MTTPNHRAMHADDFFPVREGALCVEGVPCEALARDFGTPLYVYSRAALEDRYRAYDEAFGALPHRVCFAVKANSNLAVLQTLARLGSGFDIVSGGELTRVLRAGGDPARVVFSGVGKTAAEIRQALAAGIGCFNVESVSELQLIDRIAREEDRCAPIALRVNPDVDAGTHPYISTGLRENKFGIAIEDAPALYREAAQRPGLRVVGLACHIGSQLLDLDPIEDALDRLLALVERLRGDGLSLDHLDIGGGLGVRYADELPPAPAEYVARLRPKLEACGLEIHIEPGRSIAANAGLLITRALALKPTEARAFAIVDAAMNDLLRPALYDAWQAIEAVSPRIDEPQQHYDVVGPVCESGDFLGKQRALAIREGDLLAVRGAGAYGFVMASNYNSRPRPAEILVDGAHAHVARERETVDDLMRGEHLLDSVETPRG
ncbi:diaminopimelate decarboxylase [Algiphilus sp.]|uniref:diaminopimelate decarboxylase n=1 Tax=Algiphilus sp. TaxID=1872431 RepID=UPI003B5255CE